MFTVVYSGFIVQALALSALFVLYARARWGHLWRGRASELAAQGPTRGVRRATEPAWSRRLTTREREVLTYVARGQTNAEIAESLVVSIETVNSNLRSLLSKSGTRHRTELVVRSYEAGILE